MHYIDVRYVFDTYVFDNGNLAIVYKGLILYCTYRWKYLHKYTDSLVNINFQKSIISIHKTLYVQTTFFFVKILSYRFRFLRKRYRYKAVKAVK